MSLETKPTKDIAILQRERPLFEANYVQMGGNLKHIKWSECSDGTGLYLADWESLEGLDSETEEAATENAEHLTGCLLSWVACAKSKAIPEGYFLMPSQPCIEMLSMAEKEFENVDIDDLQDRIVFAHQAMIQVSCKKLRNLPNL